MNTRVILIPLMSYTKTLKNFFSKTERRDLTGPTRRDQVSRHVYGGPRFDPDKS